MSKVIEVENVNTSNITFSELKKIQIKGTNNYFQRVSIDYLPEPEEMTPLLILKENVRSFGLWGFKDENGNKVDKFTFNLILQRRAIPSKEEDEWIKKMERIVNACFKHVKENVNIKQKLTKEHFEAFSPVKHNEKGVTLNVKVGYSKDKNKFFTDFYNREEKIDPSSIFQEQQLCDIAL